MPSPTGWRRRRRLPRIGTAPARPAARRQRRRLGGKASRRSRSNRAAAIHELRSTRRFGINERVEKQFEVLIALSAVLGAHAEEDHTALAGRDVEERGFSGQIFFAEQPPRRQD